MIIGITGGVGCGKSTVMEIFEREYQANILIADNIGHEALEEGTSVYEKIREQFGDEILLSDGQINRNQLAGIIYQDDTKRELLNSIVHPYVIDEIKKKLKQWENEALVVIETAIMFETGCHKLCDEIWAVITENEIRIQRLVESRGYTREKAESIINKQLSEEELIQKSDKVIYNNGTTQDLFVQMQELLVTNKKM